MLLGLLDDQESRTVTIGSTTTAFVTVPVSMRDVGHRLNRISVPDGELLYGVLKANGMVELAIQPMPILEEGDQIIYSRIAD
jgi:trk system potassium uptake protein TrkA